MSTHLLVCSHRLDWTEHCLTANWYYVSHLSHKYVTSFTLQTLFIEQKKWKCDGIPFGNRTISIDTYMYVLLTRLRWKKNIHRNPLKCWWKNQMIEKWNTLENTLSVTASSHFGATQGSWNPYVRLKMVTRNWLSEQRHAKQIRNNIYFQYYYWTIGCAPFHVKTYFTCIYWTLQWVIIIFY